LAKANETISFLTQLTNPNVVNSNLKNFNHTQSVGNQTQSMISPNMIKGRVGDELSPLKPSPFRIDSAVTQKQVGASPQTF